MNKNIKQLTLVIIHRNDRVLLGMKKRGFGAGKWNGFGGKVVPGESILAAAERELREEAGIVAKAMEKHGVLTFVFPDNPTLLEVHVFRAEEWSGEPTESEEMRPQWFPVSLIPFPEMWSDDELWFPLLFAQKKFVGEFFFDNEEKISRYTLEERAEL